MRRIIKAIIIDDQPEAINSLKQDLLHLFPQDIQIIGEATTIVEAVVLFKEYQPDLIFLDIDLKIGTGFDFLKQIKDLQTSDFDIIFTTAFNQFAIKAIKYSAFDYLLKPIDRDELQASMERLKSEIKSKQTTKQIDLILENESNRGVSFQKIALATSSQIYFVTIQDIVRCESDHNYTTFVLKDNSKILVSKTMKEYEGLLSQHHFMRTHQSHLVNINYVTSFLKEDGGILLLSNKDKIVVSRRKKEEVIRKLQSI